MADAGAALMTGASDRPWRRDKQGLLLRVRLTPKGGRDDVDGLTTTPDGPALKARVRAAPEDGEANAALAALVARWLGLAKGDVAMASGHKSRTKQLSIAGDPVAIEARLAAAIEALENEKAKA